MEQVGQGKTPPFSVTRHTPRTRPNVRLRTHSQDSTEASLRADKKIKMEASEKVKPKGKTGALKSEFLYHVTQFLLRQTVFSIDPLASSFKPSFKSPPKATGESAGTFGGVASLGGSSGLGNLMGGANFQVGGVNLGESVKFEGASQSSVHQESLASEHTATLQNQLALTSHMCSQLLYGQNNLIRAVCGHLDRAASQAYPGGGPGGPQMAEHMAALQQYELELEAYYHQLCESYTRVGRNDLASSRAVSCLLVCYLFFTWLLLVRLINRFHY